MLERQYLILTDIKSKMAKSILALSNTQFASYMLYFLALEPGSSSTISSVVKRKLALSYLLISSHGL